MYAYYLEPKHDKKAEKLAKKLKVDGQQVSKSKAVRVMIDAYGTK